MTPSVSLLVRAAGAEDAGPALPRGGTCGRIPARGGVAPPWLRLRPVCTHLALRYPAPGCRFGAVRAC